ncbi:hypothetical protein SAMN05216251_12731 [Actinacidiphila alni]|uniref:DUF4913 domain-containing protein n=1 Tax=Actinacidiphila alni TaxID=380248 RepID=A0A1I2L6J9_9ACTN|nr:hypothetical protein [Actinacidiphila alni]SFF74855.1 hypothetical protein SAMN05216251_12731 [Actinacidiphila alni]
MVSGGGGFDAIFAELTEINAEVVLLNERVAILEEEGPGRAGTPDDGGTAERPAGAPVLWADLEDDEHAVLWPQFVHWVIRTADTYELTTDQLPRQCWWLHGAVVEELTALWTGHQSAYAGTDDAGSAPYLWQDALARAIERIGRIWLGTCRNGQHKQRHRQPWSGDDQYLTTLHQAARPHTITLDSGEPPDAAGSGTTPSPGNT